MASAKQIDIVLQELGLIPADRPVQEERPPAIDLKIRLKRPHAKQRAFIRSRAKRKVIRAGRRGGKTTGIAIYSVERFLEKARLLYAVPTQDQITRYWTEVTDALHEPINLGIFNVNESQKFIEIAKDYRHAIPDWNPEARIRAKTAWNADTLRGDYADELILDEWQLMDEDAWHIVGAPMLMDNNGNATFIYTPPSLHSKSVSKAKDKRHASKLFKFAEAQKALAEKNRVPSIWETFHFSSYENPYLSPEGLAQVTQDLSELAIRQEIHALDLDEVPGALWKRATIAKVRVTEHPDLWRIVVGVDPPGGATECGIVAVGIGKCECLGTVEDHGFVLEDASTDVGEAPEVWSKKATDLLKEVEGDTILGEKNYGGDMVKSTISTADKTAMYKDVIATRGKAVRAEPVSALYEKGKVHHVGNNVKFQELEDEMCQWLPGSSGHSPNRMDALVWCVTELMIKPDYQPFSDALFVGTPINREFLPAMTWPKEF